MATSLLYRLSSLVLWTKAIVSKTKDGYELIFDLLFIHSMVYVQKRIATGLEVLQFFTMRQWNFKSDNFNSLVALQTPEESEMFLFDSRNTGDEMEYIKNSFLGARQYCLKDPLASLPTARVIHKM